MIERKRPENTSGKEQDPQATHLWLMRHGPTQWNLDRRVQGNVDNPVLDEELIPYFERIQVNSLPQPDKMIVTGFQRNLSTANALSDYLHWPDIPIITKPELKERNWGIFEGKTHEEILAYLVQNPEIVAKYPDIQQMTDLSPVIDAPGFKVEGAESMDEVAARVTPALLSLREEFPHQKILVVVHAGVLISQGLNHKIINTMSVEKRNGETVLVKTNNL